MGSFETLLKHFWDVLGWFGGRLGEVVGQVLGTCSGYVWGYWDVFGQF